MSPYFKALGTARGTLLPSRRNPSWSWMCLPPWACFGAHCISHSSKAGRAPSDRPLWWRVLSDSEQSEVSSGFQSDPGCCAPAWMEYLLPSDHFSSPLGFLFFYFLSVVSFLSPSSSQRTSPQWSTKLPQPLSPQSLCPPTTALAQRRTR